MRVATCLVFLLFVLPVCASGANAPGNAGGGERAAAPAGQCRTIVYSTNPNYPPYDWADAEDHFRGASIDLLQMAVPPGVKLKPVVLPWVRAMAMAESGDIDLLVSLRITPERSKYLVFTTHRAFPNPIVVFVRKDRVFPFNSWADLKGKRGGISFGDTFGGGFDEYWRKELSMHEAKTMENNFEKLESGRIDYFVTSRYVGEAYAASHATAHGITRLGPPISEQDIYFGFSRRSPCAALVEQVSNRLRELDHDGLPERLLQKHLRDIRKNSVERPQ